MAFLSHHPSARKYTAANIHYNCRYLARPKGGLAMPWLAMADRVVINLRQVAAVRMQIRLKFRSLTTDALGSSVGVLIGRQPFGPVIVTQLPRSSDVTRSPSTVREHPRAMQK